MTVNLELDHGVLHLDGNELDGTSSMLQLSQNRSV